MSRSINERQRNVPTKIFEGRPRNKTLETCPPTYGYMHEMEWGYG